MLGMTFLPLEARRSVFRERRRRDRRQPGASNSNSIKKRFGMVAKEERQMCPEEAYIRIS